MWNIWLLLPLKSELYPVFRILDHYMHKKALVIWMCQIWQKINRSLYWIPLELGGSAVASNCKFQNYKIIFVFFFWSNFEKFDRDYLTNMRLHIVDSHLFGKRDHFSKFQNCDLLSIMSKISNKCEFTICNLIFVRYLRSTELFWWSHVSNKYEIYI